MRVKWIKINNFKCLGPEPSTINWEDIILLVGENNTGKSSILQALDIFFSNKKTIEPRLFRGWGVVKEVAPVEITVAFTELTNEDKKQRGISHHLNSDGNWILRKIFGYTIGEKSDSVKYFTFEEVRDIKGLKETLTWDEVHKKFPDSEITKNKKGTNSITSEDFFNLLEEVSEKWPKEINLTGKYDWISNPGGWQSNIDSIFVNNFKLTFVRAVHEAKDESSGTNSAFYQLFNLLIGGAISNSTAIKKLKTSLLEVLALYQKDETGKHRISAIGQLEEELSKKLERIIIAKTIIQAIPPKEEKILQQILPTPSLEIDDGYQTIINEQGHGLQRTLILALLETLADHKTRDTPNIGPKNILMVEEPELYMHPQMERKMRSVLYKIASDGKFQVICTTHSPVFLDMADKHKSIVVFEKDTDGKTTIIKQVTEEIFNTPSFKDQKDRLRMILSFDPTVNELFFARHIVLVEGDSDIAAFQKSAELLKIDPHIVKNTTFINCHGKRTIPAFIRVLNHFYKNFLVVHDKDGDDEFNEIISKTAQEMGLGQVKMIENKLEDILGIPEGSKDKPILAILQVQNLYEKKQLDIKLGKLIRFIFGAQK